MKLGQRRRVVITGAGVVSPLGLTLESMWEALSSGRSAVKRLDECGLGGLPVKIGAPVCDFTGQIGDFGPVPSEQAKAIRKGLKLMCRESQMAVAAAARALGDAKWVPGDTDPDRSGVMFGSDYILSTPEEFIEAIQACLENNRFHFPHWGEKGLSRMSPLWLLKFLPNMPASHIAIYFDLRGPSNSVTLREASGTVAVAEAYQLIACGRADFMVAGATGTRLHPMKMIHSITQGEVVCDGDAESVPQPFDRLRRGMVLGEGAGALVLEDRERAVARGAKIYGEVVAAACTAGIGKNLVASFDLAFKRAVEAVLARADIKPSDVGFVNAHGLATRKSDREEAWAIAAVFDSCSRPIPVVAPKSYFGNLGAGSGVVELIAGLLALEKNTLFPTLHYKLPDPDCPVKPTVDFVAPPAKSFIKLSSTPQGQSSAILIRAAD